LVEDAACDITTCGMPRRKAPGQNELGATIHRTLTDPSSGASSRAGLSRRLLASPGQSRGGDGVTKRSCRGGLAEVRVWALRMAVLR
jgi:hypothetical protein